MIGKKEDFIYFTTNREIIFKISLQVCFRAAGLKSTRRGVSQTTGRQRLPAKLLICSLNDILDMVIILFPVQLIECTDWEERESLGRGVKGGDGHGEELMPCDEQRPHSQSHPQPLP